MQNFSANSLENHWMPFTANKDFKNDPRLVVKSEGAYMWDHKGNQILDGSAGLFCVPAGHGRKEIADAVHHALMENDYCAPFQLGHPNSFAFAQKLTNILPDEINYAFFVNSGSESIDTAIKMALAYHRAKGNGQKIRLVSRERAYHGVNIGGLSLSGMVRNRETFAATIPHVVCMRHTHLPENKFIRDCPEKGADLADDLKRIIETYGASTIAAVFVEPVAGSTGCLPPPKNYLRKLREICDENDILLVFDDVICGFGRLGAPFSADKFNVIPDIMTMAKALTNGAQPMGAVGVKDHVYQTITNASPEKAIEFFHGYTYSGHPAACAAGLATLDIYEKENLFQRAQNLSEYFLDKVFSLRDQDIVTDIRGIGLMAGIDVKQEEKPGVRGTKLQKKLFHKGLHVKFTGDAAILAPSFVFERKHVDHMIDALQSVFEEEI